MIRPSYQCPQCGITYYKFNSKQKHRSAKPKKNIATSENTITSNAFPIFIKILIVLSFAIVFEILLSISTLVGKLEVVENIYSQTFGQLGFKSQFLGIFILLFPAWLLIEHELMWDRICLSQMRVKYLVAFIITYVLGTTDWANLFLYKLGIHKIWAFFLIYSINDVLQILGSIGIFVLIVCVLQDLRAQSIINFIEDDQL